MAVRQLSDTRQKWIVRQCEARLKMSRDKMADFYDRWAKNEEQFKAYIPEKDVDIVRKNRREAGTPSYTTIQVPYSYAIGMTALTYITSVFMTRSPIIQVAGRHGEGEMQVQGMEALLDYQMNVGENLVPMFLWLFDPIKYSHGFIGHYWEKETVQCRKRVTQPKKFLGMDIPGTSETIDVIEEVTGYEGHKLFNVRPQDAFPDPRVPIWNFQKGEFFGRYVELTTSDLRSGKYYNLKQVKDTSEVDRDRGSTRVNEIPDATTYGTGDQTDDIPNFVRAHELYVRLIPRDWGIADSQREEIWVFTVSTNGVLMRHDPLGLYHNRFPFDVLEMEPDAYAQVSRSLMESMEPMNDAMTWLLNSHMFNVRAAINDQLIVDPSMVVMKDIENPAAGRVIRLKPAAYGRDIRTFMQQLNVHDVTQQNVPSMQLMGDMIQRLTGVTDNIMGMVNAGGRKTATEVRQSTSFGINRLKTICEFYSMMGFAPLTQKLIQSTQQLYTAERKYRTVGDLASFSDKFVMVDPASIAGFFDFIPVDGSLPVDRFAQANMWQMMLGQMSKVPQVMQTYDLGKLFGWVATLAGLKNVNQFRIQVGDPAQLAAQAQAGNSVPIDMAGRDMNRPPNQMQIPGMGATA